MPEKNVLLSIVAEQTVPSGETNRMEMVTEGRYFVKDGMSCLEYEEDEAGESGGATTLMMVSDRVVSLIRRGLTTTHMVFTEGKKSYNIYRTPVGSMEMGIWPTDMQLEMGEESGEVLLEYELDIGGHYTGSNMINVSYKLKGAERGGRGGEEPA